MVAMTVVLTAVLYIMVINMTGSDVGSSRWGSLDLIQTAPDSFDIQFHEFSPDARPMDLKILIQHDVDEAMYQFQSNSDGNLTFERGIDFCDMYYHDLSDNAMVNIADYVRVTNVTPGETYTVYILDAKYGGEIVSQNIDMIG